MRISVDRPPLDQPAVGADLTAIALLGTADVALFLWSRRRTIFSNTPARASGVAGGVALWSALTVSSSISTSQPGSHPWRRAVVALGLSCGAGNLALLATHLRLGKGRLRSLSGAGIGVAALASAWRWRNGEAGS